MKQLKLKTSILIASIYAALFYGIMGFINVGIRTLGPFNAETAKSYMAWKAWTPLILGMIAILLFGFLVYQTDWKKK